MSVSQCFDTNVLTYVFREKAPRSRTARTLLAEGGVAGVQVLNEFVARSNIRPRGSDAPYLAAGCDETLHGVISRTRAPIPLGPIA
jgi:predicted nucleic acid-binding protein